MVTGLLASLAQDHLMVHTGCLTAESSCWEAQGDQNWPHPSLESLAGRASLHGGLRS